MKNKFLSYVILLGFVIFFHSCESPYHENLSIPDNESDLITQAQNWVESELATITINSSTSESLYERSSKKMNWDLARVLVIPDGKIIEVPINYDVNFGAKVWNSKDENFSPKENIEFLEFLVVKWSGGEFVESKTIKLIGDEYRNEVIKNDQTHKELYSGTLYRDLEFGFNGSIVEKDLQGSVIGGALYLEGSAYGEVIPDYELKSARSKDCNWEYFIIDYYVTNCSSYGCYTSYDYSESYSVYTCNGGGSNGGGSTFDDGDFGGGTGSNTSSYIQKQALKDLTLSSDLSVTNTRRLEQAIETLRLECGFQKMLNWMKTNNVKTNWSMNSTITNNAPGGYSGTSNTIYFLNSTMINPTTVGEEIFHLYQNTYYAQGFPTYTGRSNAEFEAKLFRDLQYGGSGSVIGIWGPGQLEYFTWLFDISNGFTTLPTTYSQLQGKFFYFLNMFRSDKPEYDFPVDYNMTPSAMFKAFQGC